MSHNTSPYRRMPEDGENQLQSSGNSDERPVQRSQSISSVVLVQQRRSCTISVSKFSFAVGHVYNDLCACMWFTYLMLFLQKVLRLNSSHAGFLMLVGQVTDGIATPLVGIGLDRLPLPDILFKFGRRKTWHLFGTVLVTLSFPFIFNRSFLVPDDYEGVSEWYKVLYYVPFIMMFQIGWASVQISHLALIPHLSRSESDRTTFNSLRYAFSVLSNLLVYGFILGFLYDRTASGAADTGHTSPADFYTYRDVDLIVVGIGCYASAMFYFGVEDHPIHYSQLGGMLGRSISVPGNVAEMSLTDWFKQPQFYMIGFLYTVTRLYVNISQVYYPFYIELTQHMSKHCVAELPLIVYLASFMASNLTSVSYINQHLNRKLCYLFGCGLGLGACGLLYIMPLNEWYLRGVSVIMGAANSLLIVGALALTADLIRYNTESGAFVYGCMSFCDKICNGVAFQIIELINPSCDPSEPHEACTRFYRRLQTMVPGVCLLVCIIVLVVLLPQKIGHRPGTAHGATITAEQSAAANPAASQHPHQNDNDEDEEEGEENDEKPNSEDSFASESSEELPSNVRS